MRRAALALLAPVLLAGCASSLRDTPSPQRDHENPRIVTPQRPAKPPAPPASSSRYTMAQDKAPKPGDVPPDLLAVPDPIPRAEPRSRGGNAAQYTVFGKTYRVMDDASGYKERGGASWYGRKFHGHKTANGEVYDMFALTAAHKTLPLPTYARVTNLKNGRAVIVRINDRGPFHPGRIIDLSYTAAARLDMLQAGTADVEVEAIIPGEPLHRPPHEIDPAGPGYLQVAAFADPINAVNLREQLMGANLGPTAIWIDEGGDIAWNRVVVGPFSNERAAAQARNTLERQGHTPRWIVP